MGFINERTMGANLDRSQFSDDYVARLEEIEGQNFELDIRHGEIDAVRAHLNGHPDAVHMLGQYGLGAGEDGGLVTLDDAVY